MKNFSIINCEETRSTSPDSAPPSGGGQNG